MSVRVVARDHDGTVLAPAESPHGQMSGEHSVDRLLSATPHLRRATWLAHRTALALAVCVFASTAVAASTSPWVPATSTSIGNQLAAMDVAVDPAGNAIAAWWTAGRGIEAATRPVGAQSWRVERVARGPDLREPWPPQVRVGVDAKGNATVTWLEQYGDLGSFRVMAARRPANRHFREPQLVASGVDTFVEQTMLEVGASGHAIVLWETRPRQDSVRFANVAVAGPDGSFGEPQRIGSGVADVAVDGRGRMLVLWVALDGRSIYASSAAPGKPFGPGRVISGPLEGYRSVPQVAFGIGGTAIAVWSRWMPPSEVNVVESALGTASGTWGTPEVVTQGPWSFSAFGEYSPLIDAKGTAYMIWIAGRNNPDDDRHIATSFRPAGGRWQQPRILVPPTDANLQILDLAANAFGDAIAVWRSQEGVASAYLRNGRWGRPLSPWPETPTTAAQSSAPTPAIDAAGNAFVVWSSCCEEGVSMQAGGYDAAGPQLRTLRIPANGRVGQPLRFSASPLDVWSGRTVARWSFGDGGKATGNSVTHSYRRPGRYTVTITSSDPHGHTTIATRRIRIR